MTIYSFGLKPLPNVGAMAVKLTSRFGLTPTPAALIAEDTTSPIVVIRDSFTDPTGTQLSLHVPEIGTWDWSGYGSSPAILACYTIVDGRPSVIEYYPNLLTAFVENTGTGFYVKAILDILGASWQTGPRIQIYGSDSYDYLEVYMNTALLRIKTRSATVVSLNKTFTAPVTLKIKYLKQVFSLWINDQLQYEFNYDEFIQAHYPWWVGSTLPFASTPALKFHITGSFSGLTFFEGGILRE